MKHVFQTIVNDTRGNCTQACVASLLELELEQVPHFRLFPDETWFHVYHGFLWGCGYSWSEHEATQHDLQCAESTEGFFIASVPSKTFKGVFHNVIIDRSGLVVHDPNPNMAWLSKNVFDTMDTVNIDLLNRRSDYPWKD